MIFWLGLVAFLQDKYMPEISTGKALLDPKKILTEAGITAEMNVADLGSGTSGHFVFPAAHMVGDKGKVYAVDILKGALAGVESRARLENVTNVETVWGDLEVAGGARIEESIIDLALLINIAGLAKKSPNVINEARRILKSSGTLLVVDWKPEAPALGPDPASRVSQNEMIQLFTGRGFIVKKSFNAGPNHWGVILKKAEL